MIGYGRSQRKQAVKDMSKWRACKLWSKVVKMICLISICNFLHILHDLVRFLNNAKED